MAHLDEARYGRTCLLVLNVCPFTLRLVIDDYYSKQGSPNIQDFLEKNKHDLYHIMTKKCCCRLIPSRVTPMYRSQWDLLFKKNTSLCSNGSNSGDCPCKFDADPVITSKVMDISLCCLVIKNICQGQGINMIHIDMIRDIRNKLIHAGCATLDEQTYKGYWRNVKTAILDLANNVSPTVHTDTLKMIQDLETRVMDRSELEELSKVIVYQKKVEERVSEVEKDLEKTNKSVKRTDERLDTLEENVKQLEENVKQSEGNVKQLEGNVDQLEVHVNEIEANVNQTLMELEGTVSQRFTTLKESIRQDFTQLEDNISQRSTQLQDNVSRTASEVKKLGEALDLTVKSTNRTITNLEGDIRAQVQNIKEIKEELNSKNDIVSDDEPDINKLKERLLKMNNDVTKRISLSPLQEERGTELPIELLFAQVVIYEDPQYTNYSSDERIESDSGANLDSHYYGTKRFLHRKLSMNQNKFINPGDIFNLDNEVSTDVYMFGDAAHGKTTFCLWLLRKWCHSQNRDGLQRELDVWETALKEFDFVFLLQFRYVNPKRACVTDMVCKDISKDMKGCHTAIHHVLSSEKYRCLVIMDGLDEWNPNEDAKKQLAHQGVPNLDELSSKVTCFFSMRHWIFSEISNLVRIDDRVIEIIGLSEDGREKVMENVLVNRYKLEKNSSKYNNVYERMKKHFNQKSLKSFMKIPLLAVLCVQIWYEGKQVGDSMTSFYAAMLNMLIERANHKYRIKIEHGKSADYTLPEILSEYENIENCTSVLLRLGKIAYANLISGETNLVFQKRKLEMEIGVKQLQVLLDVGLISQKEAPSLLTKNVCVQFFHKSIQELLAAIYIVTNKEVGDSFRKHLTNVKVIMELSNVIMFICGMCPSLGSDISQRVVSVTDSDTKICKYRDSPWGGNSTVIELYRLQVSWYRELQNTRTYSPVKFHISYVHLFRDSDKETVKMTKKILSDPNIEINSLWTWYIPADGDDCNINLELNNFLCNKYKNTKSMFMVCVHDDTITSTICIPTIRNLYLHLIQTNSTDTDVNVHPPLLSHITLLQMLWLDDVTLGNRTLGLSADMVHIQNIWLVSVNMSVSGWQQFVSSIKSIQHRFEVELKDTNIDDASKTKIRTSLEFNVKRDCVNEYGRCVLYFVRVWPFDDDDDNDDDDYDDDDGNDGDDDDNNDILYTRL